MKTTLRLLAFAILLISSASLHAGVLLYEPFSYAPSDLSISGNWAASGSGTGASVVSGNLDFPGLQASVGNRVFLSGNGKTYTRGFQGVGTAYLSFVMNVESLAALTASGTPVVSMTSGANGPDAATIWVRRSGAGFNLGAKKSSGSVAYNGGVLPVGTPLWVLISYEYRPYSTINRDVVNVWARSSESAGWFGRVSLPGSAIQESIGLDYDTISGLRLHRTALTPNVSLDEIRVGTTGVDILPQAFPLLANQNASRPTATTAALHAEVRSYGEPTTTWFEWGASPAFGQSTSTTSISNSYTFAAVNTLLTGLSPSAPYYFRAVAQNAAGVAYGATIAVQPFNPPPEVTRYYRFETDAGMSISNGQVITSADDSSGNGRHGVPVGNPTYATSPFMNPLPSTGANNGFSFSGDAGIGRGIILNPDGAPVIGATFTVETFLSLSSTDPGTGDGKQILRCGDETAQPFAMYIWNFDNSGGTNDLYVYLNGDSFALGYLNLVRDRNYHIAVTYNGATMSLYIDGALVSSGNFSGYTGTGSKRCVIGNQSTGPGSLEGSRVFPGRIDELRISSVALPPSKFLIAPNSAPVISLIGGNPFTFEAAATYADPGATASDLEDGVLTPTISSSTVLSNVPGNYSVTWLASDSNLTATATRIVNVVDTTAPVLQTHANVFADATGPTGAVVTYAAGIATDVVGITSLTYSQNSGTFFPIGVTTVTMTAVDAAGNTGTADFTVTVIDATAPIITFTPPPQTVNTGNNATAALPDVTALVTATDNVGIFSKTQSPTAGTLRAPGTYDVVVTVLDAAGNLAQTTVQVTVRDNFAPSITSAPLPQTVNTGNNASAALPDIAALVIAADNVGIVSMTQAPAAGTQKAPGTYDVVVTALDAAGLAAQTTVQVTVRDNFAPAITLTPPPQTVNTGNNPTAALPDLTLLVTATDNVGIISKTQSPAAGTQKAPGIYDVVVTASDAAGLTAQTTVQVTVRDNFAPTITFTPPLQTVNTGNNPTAALPDLTALVTATDNVGIFSKTQSPIAGTQKEPGTYDVVVTALDAAGLSAQTTVQVTVRDSAAPVFTTVPLARSIRAGTDEASIATPDLTGEAAATDNIGVVGITQSPLAGSPLAVGIHTIVLTATDAQGNSSTANVQVTVLLGNRTPVAAYDSVFAMSRTVTFDVLANDSDADGDALSLVSFTQPEHGRVTRVGNSLRFDPALGVAVAGEFFTYTISDGEVTATGTVEISPVPNGRRFSGGVDDAGGPCGLITLAFTKPGNFTGFLSKDGVRHPFTGAINLSGIGVGVVKINVTTTGGLTFRPGGLTPSGEPRMLVGITGVAAMPTAEVFVEQSPFWASASTPLVGQFSVALKKDTTPGNSQTSGYAVVKLSRNGSTTHVGKAPNGQTFSSSGQLLSGGRIGLHGALGAASVRRGFVAGTLVLDGAGNTISGDLRWKLPPLRDVRYPAGLDTMLAPIGDRYTRSTTAHGALGSAVPVVRTFQFSEGVFPVPVFANVTFGVPLIADTFAAPITYFATSPSIGKVLGYAKPVTVRYSFDGIILQLRGEIHGAVRSTTTLSAVGSE